MAIRGRAIAFRGSGIVAPEITVPDAGGGAPDWLPEGAVVGAEFTLLAGYSGAAEAALADLFTSIDIEDETAFTLQGMLIIDGTNAPKLKPAVWSGLDINDLKIILAFNAPDPLPSFAYLMKIVTTDDPELGTNTIEVMVDDGVIIASNSNGDYNSCGSVIAGAPNKLAIAITDAGENVIASLNGGEEVSSTNATVDALWDWGLVTIGHASNNPITSPLEASDVFSGRFTLAALIPGGGDGSDLPALSAVS